MNRKSFFTMVIALLGCLLFSGNGKAVDFDIGTVYSHELTFNPFVLIGLSCAVFIHGKGPSSAWGSRDAD